MKKLTKAQVTGLLQTMLDEFLKSHDERICVDNQSPLVETDEGWTMEFSRMIDDPSSNEFILGNNFLQLYIVAQQKTDYYDNETDEDVWGEWDIIVKDEDPPTETFTEELIKEITKTSKNTDWRNW